MSELSPFERLGGEEELTRIVDRFVDAVAADLMIGFFFDGVDLARVKLHERELARTHLGGPAGYSGRPIGAAHAKHPIREGHFARRLKLLEETLAACEVPADVAEGWLAHDRRLRESVVRGDCNTPGSARSLPTLPVDRPR